MFLIGEAIGHIMIELCLNALTIEKFYIGQNMGKIVTEYSLSAGYTYAFAAQGLVVFSKI